MSWDSYTTTLCQYPGVTEACLCGVGGEVWAKSEKFRMTPEEISELAKHAAASSTEANRYDGVKLTTLRANDGTVISRSSEVALSCASSKTAVVIAVHAKSGDMPMGVNQQLAAAAEKVADHLKSLDY